MGHLAKFGHIVFTLHSRIGSWGWYFVPTCLMMVPVRCYIGPWLHVPLHPAAVPPDHRRAARGRDPGRLDSPACADRSPGTVLACRLQERGDHPARRIAVRCLFWHIDHAPPAVRGHVVGSWGADVIGYCARVPVVNLDGLVNSWDYYSDHRRGIGPTITVPRLIQATLRRIRRHVPGQPCQINLPHTLLESTPSPQQIHPDVSNSVLSNLWWTACGRLVLGTHGITSPPSDGQRRDSLCRMYGIGVCPGLCAG